MFDNVYHRIVFITPRDITGAYDNVFPRAIAIGNICSMTTDTAYHRIVYYIEGRHWHLTYFILRWLLIISTS